MSSLLGLRSRCLVHGEASPSAPALRAPSRLGGDLPPPGTLPSDLARGPVLSRWAATVVRRPGGSQGGGLREGYMWLVCRWWSLAARMAWHVWQCFGVSPCREASVAVCSPARSLQSRSTLIVQWWFAGGVSRKRTHRCGMHLWRAQHLLRLYIQPDLDVSPHGTTGSDEEELEVVGFLLLLPTAMTLLDLPSVETTIRPRGALQMPPAPPAVADLLQLSPSSSPLDTLVASLSPFFLFGSSVIRCPCLLLEKVLH